MNFYDRYVELCSEHKLSPQSKTMMEITKVSSPAISGWKNNGSLPKCDIICNLADFFNVTTDYLLGRTDVRVPVITELTTDELLIIEQYRNCSNESRASIRNVINSFYQSSPKPSHPESSASKIG